MNRFLKMTSLAALCALLAVPAGAGAARGDFDLSASGLNTSGYAQQLGAPKSYGSEKLSLKMPKENAVQDGVNPITGEAFSGEYRPTLVSIDAHPAALPHWPGSFRARADVLPAGDVGRRILLLRLSGRPRQKQHEGLDRGQQQRQKAEIPVCERHQQKLGLVPALQRRRPRRSA